MWKVGDIISGEFDKYKVLDVKMGGMGIVYIVYAYDWKKRFAMKTFRDEYSWGDDIAGRFVSEGTAWKKLMRHKNIVWAEFSEWMGKVCPIVLEYIDGMSLREYLAGNKLLNISQALDFAIQFCEGMDYACKKIPGLLHRDIKPGNIMITKEGIVKITDFGIAKIYKNILDEEFQKIAEGEEISPQALSQSKTGGTLYYMSPEHLYRILPEELAKKLFNKPPKIDTHSDIYSFGATLYEMLTGKIPYYPTFARTQYEAQQKFINGFLEGNLKTPVAENLSLTEELNNLILKCLARNPDTRFQNFGELKEKLLQIYTNLTGKKYEVKKEPRILSVKEYMKIAAYNLPAGMGSYEDVRLSLGYYDEVLKINPKHIGALCGKANLFSSLASKAFFYDPRGYIKRALWYCNQVIEIDSKCADAWRIKADASSKCEDLGDLEKALICYNEALKINPEDVEAWRGKGNLLAKLERFTESLKCYDEIVNIKPMYKSAWESKCRVLLLLDRVEDAIECYIKILKIDPEYYRGYISPISPPPLTELTDKLMKSGGPEEVLKYYNRVLEMNPKDVAILHAKGNLLYEMGKLEEGLSYLRKIGEIEVSMTTLTYVTQEIIKWSRRYIKEGLYKNAIKCLTEAFIILGQLETLPYLPFNYKKLYSEVNYLLGVSYDKEGDYWEAICALDSAIRYAKPDTLIDRDAEKIFNGIMNNKDCEKEVKYRALLILMVTFMTKGILNKAEAACKRAIKIKPNDPKAYCQLGCFYALNNMDKDAITFLEKGLALTPEGQLKENIKLSLIDVQNKINRRK